MIKGTIFNIQRFSINDGPGIRSTVFYKGCPLNCLWCHNPESKSKDQEILFDVKKCLGCMRCAELCPSGCHSLRDNLHVFDRFACRLCGKCAEVCYADALEIVGYQRSVSQILEEVLKDKVFYDCSGGGVTLSGGEPMYQLQFTYELLAELKKFGLHTCMETCGYAGKEAFRKIAGLVDIFLFDYKETDSGRHETFTGASNARILENLRLLDDLGCKIILRCPIIPTLNDTREHLEGIAATANSLKNILQIDVEPYHPLGTGKAENLGKAYPLMDLTFPSNETVDGWVAQIAAKTDVPVKKG